MVGFKNRSDAGKKLAAKLLVYADRPDVIVLGLPRGGIPVAFEVSQELGVPLDVFVVRKVGVPGQEELAMGAIASGNVTVMNESIVRSLGISRDVFSAIAKREGEELRRREKLYRRGSAPLDLKGRTVILIDDGLATGATMKAAVEAIQLHAPKRTVVAVPAADPETCEEMRDEADDVVCAITPDPFFSVGTWYEDFAQTTDEDVQRLLEIAHQNENSRKDNDEKTTTKRYKRRDS
jgi:predicted phosphoribosyltransferase